MPPFPLRTLTARYALLFSALVGTLLLLSGAVAGYFAYRQSIEGVEELQREKVHRAADEIEGFIGRIESALHVVVDKFPLSGSLDAEDLRAELFALLRHQPSLTELRWVTSEGAEWIALSRVRVDETDSGRTWTDDPRFVATRAQRSYAGPVTFRSETEPNLSLAVRRQPGGPLLMADVNLNFVSAMIAQWPRGAEHDSIYVVDEHGRLISHSDASLVANRTDLLALPQVAALRDGQLDHPMTVRDARSARGEDVFSTGMRIPALGWTVFTERPRGEALQPVYDALRRSAALIVLGLAIAVALSLVFADRLVRPIREIEAGARELEEGRLDRRIDVRTGDELEALGEQFNRMAHRLQSIYETQEQRIDERTRALALANESKSRFLAAASHDLRQPMHALSLFVGQLRRRIGTADADALLERIERSADSLAELLEAVLDLSRLDMGAVSANKLPFPVDPLLSGIVARLAPLAEAKGLALTTVATSLWIRSDPVLVQRILVNIVTNAISYAESGRILVGCRRGARSVRIVVADTGTGIAPEHLPHIFEEFYRAVPDRSSIRGLGLGLAIVQRLVSLLGLEISVRSKVGKGTVVTLVLPRSEIPTLQSEPAIPAEPSLRGASVLVVDDDGDVRDAIVGLLVQWECEIVAVSSGAEAVSQVRNSPPDLLLCDLSLAEGESGLDVAKAVCELHPGVRCAFITGESVTGSVDSVRAAGYAIAFKPLRPSKLRALIEHLLATSRAGASKLTDPA